MQDLATNLRAGVARFQSQPANKHFGTGRGQIKGDCSVAAESAGAAERAMIRKLAIDRNTPDSADLRQRRGCCFDTAVNDTLQNKRNIPGLGQRILRVEHVSLDE